MKFAFSIGVGEADGYGKVGNKIRKAFAKRSRIYDDGCGFDWDAQIVVSTPRPNMIGKFMRPDVVYHTMYEAVPLPPVWPAVLNRVGLVWVPSKHSLKLFQDSGVETPIIYVPYGQDTTDFWPIRREVKEDQFNIMAWATNFVSRKNVIETVRAFQAADLPADAHLHVKLYDIPQNFSGSFMGDDGNPIPNVHIHNENWDLRKLREFLWNMDVGIYASGGEGYGLMVADSMATDLPMISTANTGLAEFVDETHNLVIEDDGMEECTSYSAGFGVPSYTYRPNFEQMVEHLRWAYLNREELYEIGRRGGKHVRSRTWDDVAEEAIAAIEEHMSVPAM